VVGTGAGSQVTSRWANQVPPAVLRTTNFPPAVERTCCGLQQPQGWLGSREVRETNVPLMLAVSRLWELFSTNQSEAGQALLVSWRHGFWLSSTELSRPQIWGSLGFMGRNFLIQRVSMAALVVFNPCFPPGSVSISDSVCRLLLSRLSFSFENHPPFKDSS
jgi:hypothetical protein